MRFIEEWRSSWRFASNWYFGIAIAALMVWNMMPPILHRKIPDEIEIAVGVLLWAGAWYARIIAQPKTREKIEAKKASHDLAA